MNALALQGDRVRPSRSTALAVRVPAVPVWPAVLLFYCILIPEEARLQLGDFRLYAYRLCLFALLPFTLSVLTRGKVRLGLLDLLVVAAGFWMVGSMMYHEGFGKGLESGGVVAFDLVSAYLVGRCFLRSPGQLRRFLKSVFPGVAAVAIVFALESVGHVLLIRPVAGAIFGTAVEGRGAVGAVVRNGLVRAFGPFPHPILGGLLVASFLPLYWLSFRGRTGKLGAVAALAAFFTMSSAGIMSLVLNIMSMITDRVVKTVREITWSSILWTALALGILVHFASQSGLFSVIIRYLTLDAGTGFYRLLIWEYGWAEVLRHPMLGIGFDNWIRPSWMYSDSVDAHWLALAMQHGLPVALSILFVTVASIGLLAARRAAFDPVDSRVAAAVAFSLASMFLMMFTVTLWNNVNSWFYLLLGGAVGIAKAGAKRPMLVHTGGGVQGDGAPARASEGASVIDRGPAE